MNQSVKPIETQKFYAVFNYLGEANNGTALYIITDSKEEIINLLNKSYRELTGENYTPYSMEDMENHILDTYISDDWAMVTHAESEFLEEIELTTTFTKKQVELYINQ